jgi:hypothetical protein
MLIGTIIKCSSPIKLRQQSSSSIPVLTNSSVSLTRSVSNDPNLQSSVPLKRLFRNRNHSFNQRRSSVKEPNPRTFLLRDNRLHKNFKEIPCLGTLTKWDMAIATQSNSINYLRISSHSRRTNFSSIFNILACSAILFATLQTNIHCFEKDN